MKKSTFITLLLIIFVLMAGTISACFFVRERASDTYQDQEPKQEQKQVEIKAAEETANDDTQRELESMINYNGTLYSLKQVEYNSGLPEEAHALYGAIEESVSRYEKPARNLTTNDALLEGKEVYQYKNERYSDALLVYVDKEKWIYAPYEEVPEELKRYAFRNEQELVYFAIERLEEEGYRLSANDGSDLIQFNALPEEFKKIDVVYEKALDYSPSPRYVQMWYCEEPYRLLVLTQEEEEAISYVPFGSVNYIDRTRSLLSPEFAWVARQAHYRGYRDGLALTAELYAADKFEAGYGDKILSELTGPLGLPCPYTSLTFSGRDVNAQHYPRSYSTEDGELIEKVWKVLNSPDRIEVSEYEGYEDVMDLQFFGMHENERVILLPNDNCKYLGTGKKYCLPQGSYAAISALLTDYTTANYSFTIDEDFLSIDTDSQEELVFMFDIPAKYVLPSVTGDFTGDWALIPTDIKNWDHEGRFGYIQNIYTREGFGPVEISVYFDELLIGISCDGKTELFYTDQSTMDSIDQLTENVRKH